MTERTFMNLPEEYRKENARFLILPIAYEGDMTAHSGAKEGAHAILDSSQELEYYDLRFDQEPFLKGIRVLPTLNCSEQDPKTAHETIAHRITELKSRYPEAFIITIGGDHSITQGICSGLDAINPDYSVIMFDAHADLRHSWNNSSHNHACTGYVLSKKHDILISGVRSLDSDEKQYADLNTHITLLPVHTDSKDTFAKSITSLFDTVYISIDVDVFDPSLIRYTGTPEPEGMGWNEILERLEHIFRTKTVKGIDLVEFSPRDEFSCYAEQYALAKLIYHICSLVILTDQ